MFPSTCPGEQPCGTALTLRTVGLNGAHIFDISVVIALNRQSSEARMDDKGVCEQLYLTWNQGETGVFNMRFWMGVPLVVLLLASGEIGNAAEKAKDKANVQWRPDLKTAWKDAREHQRPLLLLLTMDDCTHCLKMQRTTLQDKTVQGDLKTRFVPVALNIKDAPELVKLLRIRTLPTLVVIRPNGDVVDSIRGYQTPKQLRERLITSVRHASHENRSNASR
jgi:thioredoxin-related protein